eukprot:1183736-Prorocentrum_minimum.AAC.1
MKTTLNLHLNHCTPQQRVSCLRGGIVRSSEDAESAPQHKTNQTSEDEVYGPSRGYIVCRVITPVTNNSMVFPASGDEVLVSWDVPAPSIAFNIHIIAFNIHIIAFNIHIIAFNIHIIAFNIHIMRTRCARAHSCGRLDSAVPNYHTAHTVKLPPLVVKSPPAAVKSPILVVKSPPLVVKSQPLAVKSPPVA